MSIEKNLKKRKIRRAFRVRSALRNGSGLRISIFRSLKNIGAQIIDDAAHATLVSFSSLNLKKVEGDKKTVAKQVGVELGKLAQKKGVKDVYFDRGSYRYHGRVRAFAEGLRESGLKF